MSNVVLSSIPLETVSAWKEASSWKAEWNELASLLACSTTFSGSQWYESWYRTLGAGTPIRWLFARRDGQLVGVFPLYASAGGGWAGVAARRGRYLQDDHFPQSQLIIHPWNAEEVLGAFLRHLFEGPCGVSQFQIRGISALSPDYTLLKNVMRELRLPFVESRDQTAYCFDTGEVWEAFLAGKNKSFRAEARRAQRIQEQEGLEVRLVTTEKEMETVLPDLVGISEKSWQGRAGTGTFASPRYLEFYAEQARVAAGKGNLILLLLERRSGEGREPIGFALSIADGARLDSLKSEFDPAFEQLKPGNQLFRRLYAEAHARGLKTVNTGTYPTEFKRRWATREEPHCAFRIFSPTLFGRTWNQAYRLRQRAYGTWRGLAKTSPFPADRGRAS